MQQLVSGDRRGVVVLQPLLHSGPFIGAPIRSYHWVNHHALQQALLLVGCMHKDFDCASQLMQAGNAGCICVG